MLENISSKLHELVLEKLFGTLFSSSSSDELSVRITFECWKNSSIFCLWVKCEFIIISTLLTVLIKATRSISFKYFSVPLLYILLLYLHLLSHSSLKVHHLKETKYIVYNISNIICIILSIFNCLHCLFKNVIYEWSIHHLSTCDFDYIEY